MAPEDSLLGGSPYIVVEGPIAVGKTSLAKILSLEFGAQEELDPADRNPFLRSFYGEQARWALAAQLKFLTLRRTQQSRIKALGAENQALARPVISDYLLAKDEIFARLTLAEMEFALYRELSGALAQNDDSQFRKPDLVVYLEASYEVLQARLRKRNRDFERHISPKYLESLSEAYRTYFHSYEEAPLLVVNCSAIDFLENGDERVDLIREIRSARRGVQHYIPLGSR
ncbi:MAG: deoxynucleoside kinase [Candidatus Binatia bacterium]|nr:deoxynucleoside kinase [Candidatus Binatia bacterium]